MNPLPRDFYQRDTVQVAKELLGKPFVCTISDKPLCGIFIETEAYQSDDEACHAYRGKTGRNQALFGQVGHTYVYLSYGIHFCMNIVAKNSDKVPAGGVLIRGIVLQESDMRFRIIDGPGRTGKALGITIEHNGIDVTDPDSLLIIGDEKPLDQGRITVTTRVGLSKGTDKLWRFFYRP